MTPSEIYNLNSSSSIKENDFIVRNPLKKFPGQHDFAGKFCQTNKEELKQKSLQSLSENRRGRNAFQLVLWVYVTLQPKEDKWDYRAKPFINTEAKILNKILAN